MLSSVRDQFHAAYLSTSGAGGENVSETLSLLSDSQTVRVSMAQTRQPLTDKYGRYGAVHNGRKGNGDELGFAEMKQELAEARNTIAQLRKNQAPDERQSREG